MKIVYWISPHAWPSVPLQPHGTVVAFSCRLLQHGVSSVGGNQCCFAYYMRDNIHNWIGIPMWGLDESSECPGLG
ncbi:hypothetical protein F5J12DRAFT_716660 [Pisolithus orientalis]|uniref:uncharacterized protein n=1 Tax=Pisolithus orientalis TaxID=936130 RepID=UPI002224F048|nr:uncharacterized protein F5J12DRAFT_716660 [Pisolithus orientalis]KAI6019590.1 hypothetical protein F5J12DRAFT_716660 [Pisolithus orientalis]